jgi:cellulose synthase/poly-beta-1,6-N-acetylglucosamine synthase-like glycosyltransferase
MNAYTTHGFAPSMSDTQPGPRSTPVDRSPRQPALLGQLLIEAGLITPDQLQSALAQQAGWGARLGDVLLAMGWVKPQEFYPTLARHFGVSFVDLDKAPPDASLFDPKEYADYATHLYLPWRIRDGGLWIVVTDPTSPWMEARWGDRDDVYFVMTSKEQILAALQCVAGKEFSDDAIYHLATVSPQHSAREVLTADQKFIGAVIVLLTLFCFWQFPLYTLLTLGSLMNGFLAFSFLFRTALCRMSCAEGIGQRVTREDVDALKDEDLPVYTVLVPMYKEPNVLPILAAALKRMDYPKSKLDIKLVLEENDLETIAAARALALPSNFEIVCVPHSLPKTKPKACNYALRLARGEYLTIYDAEDKPEPDQLKKVLVAFQRMGKRTACIQAHLNYFNAEENWLTRMFTLEYSLWFDLFLPALDVLGFPIPLGGTSNHFHLKKLLQVGGWDPFNVTEDADLGLRFSAHGYRVGVVNSVTYEEANSQVGNWIRQRSRWIKGYVQTWLVNMRDPVGLLSTVGLKGFVSFQLFIGGTIVSGLTFPFILAPVLLAVLKNTLSLDIETPQWLLLLSALNLTAGNSFLIYLSMLAAVKRKNLSLMPYAFTVPAYWLLQSIAAYKGVFQLITNPFYWEKTNHGISKSTQIEIERANSTSA